MKKIFFILCILCYSHISFSQTYKFYQTDNINNQLRLQTVTGEVYQIQNDGQMFLLHKATTPDDGAPNRYSLHKTKNMWTYILLDEYTGCLWQCQYSTKSADQIFSVPINTQYFSYSDTNKFTVQPLVSMYQYYLINNETGEMWKFQWTTKGDDYRWIERFKQK
ncbi:MAG: hypothetical protein SNH01_05965 [Rikenellaceae bacterium]